MNISLTWANYALLVSVCLIAYYLIVALLFYRKDFLSLLAKRENNVPFESYDSSLSNDDYIKNTNLTLFGEEIKEEDFQSLNEEKNLSPDTQDFADEIMAYTSSCGAGIKKEQLIQNLRKIILKYPSLADSESKYGLSQLITMLTENDCSIHLSAEEVSELWKA